MKKGLLVVFLLSVLSVSLLMADNLIVNMRAQQLEKAIKSQDINQVKEVFNKDYSEKQLRNLMIWAKNNPEKLDDQISLLKRLDFLTKTLGNINNQSSSLGTIVYPDPLITLDNYSFKLVPQKIYFNLKDKKIKDYDVLINDKEVVLTKTKDKGIFIYEVKPNLYQVEISDKDGSVVKNEKIYPYNNEVSFNISPGTRGWY